VSVEKNLKHRNQRKTQHLHCRWGGESRHHTKSSGFPIRRREQTGGEIFAAQRKGGEKAKGHVTRQVQKGPRRRPKKSQRLNGCNQRDHVRDITGGQGKEGGTAIIG